jgi:hypothetical protein
LIIPFAKKIIQRILNRNNQVVYEGVNQLETNQNIEIANNAEQNQQNQQIEINEVNNNSNERVNQTYKSELKKNNINLNDSLSTMNESRIDILNDSTDLSNKQDCKFRSTIITDQTEVEL